MPYSNSDSVRSEEDSGVDGELDWSAVALTLALHARVNQHQLGQY